jgi:hypothetical protein
MLKNKLPSRSTHGSLQLQRLPSIMRPPSMRKDVDLLRDFKLCGPRAKSSAGSFNIGGLAAIEDMKQDDYDRGRTVQETVKRACSTMMQAITDGIAQQKGTQEPEQKQTIKDQQEVTSGSIHTAQPIASGSIHDLASQIQSAMESPDVSMEDRIDGEELVAAAETSKKRPAAAPLQKKKTKTVQKKAKTVQKKANTVHKNAKTVKPTTVKLPFPGVPRKAVASMQHGDFRIYSDMNRQCWRVQRMGERPDKAASWKQDAKAAWAKVCSVLSGN